MQRVRLVLVAVVLVFGLGLTSAANACMFDVDCAVGSKCLKPDCGIYGICVGGMNPGNANDKRPIYSPTDPNHTFGDTCQFDVNCGPGNRCFKDRGQIWGVCVR